MRRHTGWTVGGISALLLLGLAVMPTSADGPRVRPAEPRTGEHFFGADPRLGQDIADRDPEGPVGQAVDQAIAGHQKGQQNDVD